MNPDHARANRLDLEVRQLRADNITLRRQRDEARDASCALEAELARLHEAWEDRS